MIDIEGFKNYMVEEELSKNTIECYMRGIKKYSEMFDEITKPNLIEFKQHLLQNFKPQTVNNRLTSVLRYCKFKNIKISVKSIKEPKKTSVDNVINREQYDKLLNGLKSDGNERFYVIVTLLGKTGMRISEAIRVTKKDILNGKVSMNTKAHMRTIYFPKSLVNDIQFWLDKITDNETVMQNSKGEPITSRGIDERLKYFAKKYDIPKEVMHAHSFRHFFAIEFIKRNNNISLLADILGHSNVNVTQIYLRQSMGEQKDAVDEAVNW